MNTFLGVAGQLGPDDIDRATIEAAQVTYLEGYLWDPPPAKAAFLEAARIAHGAGRKVALSLSDSFCVDRHRQDFRDLVGKHVDILFANEAEILSLYEVSDLEAAVAEVQRQGLLAALTLGEKGALVVQGDERVAVAAEPVAKVVDTTGAGDLFASGFLHGLTRSCDLETCARLGAIAAGEIIGHYGARPDTPLDRLVEERGLGVC